MDTLSQIALTMTPGLGPTALRKLLEVFPDEDIFSLSATELNAAFGHHKEVAHNIHSKVAFARAEQELRYAEEHHIKVLFLTDEAFPQRLNQPDCADCPTLLYVLGDADLNPQRSLAVVGTRRATPYGRDMTERIVSQLKPYGTPIISGLAYGIDTASHSAALQQGMPTVAVLGHGLDRIYPPENRRLAADIVEAHGALISEYPSQTAINPRYFPARNRIIAAMADAVLVVEASEKGGALITAGIAAGYHREVFAVPGRLTDPYSVGTNSLIANNKAVLARTADDIALQMGWPEPHARQQAAAQQQLPFALPPEEQKLLDLVSDQEPISLDQLASTSGLPMPKLAALLFNLEMEQAVHCLPGHLYCCKH